ncbi:retron Ec78 anti-phage system effector HNH endonuclease PtuB [Methylicorpusculum sp.]|uniref:retron Ec78 anti-phage system effector HNH endonuclease PtuB n=1 Tax=Methylicorpusculum sp. TaxID=2713644 RepID=UPI002717364A|nr:retron Ec78 anti-phage system effector HNH endonuclease PtuB [Methylicorpusculum sp.]MDO8844772.1 retron Ec78 anti-phage system effector HNH endonuclease PtuB [Methylicorpusculum sp.]
MKKVQKGAEPKLLESYRIGNPGNSWSQYRRNTDRRDQIYDQLRSDQGGLCAYCEIDLKPKNASEAADFRVEHFHPKSDISTSHNWHLDWQNLLACCHGDSRPDVVDAGSRFANPHSCDVPKGENDWDNLIFNPLHLPAYPCLFQFNRSDGSISVNVANCNNADVDITKAQATIDNLNLDGVRLRNLRKPVLNQLNLQLRILVESGYTVDDARNRLAQAALKKDNNTHWPAFFSAIRDYLGAAAEKQLAAINYNG